VSIHVATNPKTGEPELDEDGNRLECMEEDDLCSGEVVPRPSLAFRLPGYVRCDYHWEQRLAAEASFDEYRESLYA
jgi:hypothetical protein